MRGLPILAALALGACTYVERQPQPERPVVLQQQPAPTTTYVAPPPAVVPPPAVTVRPGY